MNKRPFLLEEYFTRQFERYLTQNPRAANVPIKSLEGIQRELRIIENATGEKPVLIYVVFDPRLITKACESGEVYREDCLTHQGSLYRYERQNQDEDRLVIVMVTSEGKPRLIIPKSNVTRNEVVAAVEFLSEQVTREKNNYLERAKKLYSWLVKPVEESLQQENKKATNLVFIMDSKLRSLPLAVLHDGQDFIINNYSVGLMPSMSLTDTRYRSVNNLSALVMGTSNFDNAPPPLIQEPLPAATTEIEFIKNNWEARAFPNNEFTIDNFRRNKRVGIIHLATHAKFQGGTPIDSFIQFWGDEYLSLEALKKIGLSNFQSPVELLVLSACQTALGDEQAELGFAGLAHQAGVKSVVASLDTVPDEGALALITQFYMQLKQGEIKIKAEALRRAQLAIRNGQARIENRRLFAPNLPPEGLPIPENTDYADITPEILKHPRFWALFTIVGSPW